MDLNAINPYVAGLFVQEDEVLQRISRAAAGLPNISVKPYEGHLLSMLVRVSGAKKIVEIGTLAGYSGTWMARALPGDGHLWTLDKNPDHVAVASQSFLQAGVADRVTIMEGDAHESLRSLTKQGPFDLVFIDADKPSYPFYLDWAGENLRSGGLMLAHNALRDGAVLNPNDETSQAMAEFNQLLAHDSRFDSFIFTIGDGMAVGVKK
jgi:caffeoyl-CoA O-methyltransferase